jgi:hypothetical protein
MRYLWQAVGQGYRQMPRRRGESESAKRCCLHTRALAKPAAARAGMERMMRGMIRAPGVRMIDAAGKRRWSLVRAVRDRGRRGSRRARVPHRYMNRRGHLTQHGKDGNQPTMSRSGHAPSVSLRPRRGIDPVPVPTSHRDSRGKCPGSRQARRRPCHSSDSAIDLTWSPCASDTTATGRPLLSIGVTLIAR